jgi:dTDP-glucose pyrophosphorylase
MNILIPMAGAGSRFAEQGYALSKPVIPTTLRRTGKKVPMVVAAVADLPLTDNDNQIIFVVRDFHVRDAVPQAIKEYYPKAKFLTIENLTAGQASTCLLAKALIDNDQSLLIAACDNGMDIDKTRFQAVSDEADAIIFTFRNNEAVCVKPQAYGWIRAAGDVATGVSIKQPISDTPMKDHAVVGTFWFRRGKDFVSAAEAMIALNDRINNEFYVDQVFKYLIDLGLRVRVLEVSRYICWGTPDDYDNYERTLTYWKEFLDKEKNR